MTKFTQDILDIIISVESHEDPLPQLWVQLKNSLSSQERKILSVLRFGSWTSTAEICEALDKPPNHLGVILNRLYKTGLIMKHKRTTPTGHECLWQSKVGRDPMDPI